MHLTLGQGSWTRSKAMVMKLCGYSSQKRVGEPLWTFGWWERRMQSGSTKRFGLCVLINHFAGTGSQ